jgi:hypothetical protein
LPTLESTLPAEREVEGAVAVEEGGGDGKESSAPAATATSGLQRTRQQQGPTLAEKLIQKEYILKKKEEE